MKKILITTCLLLGFTQSSFALTDQEKAKINLALQMAVSGKKDNCGCSIDSKSCKCSYTCSCDNCPKDCTNCRIQNTQVNQVKPVYYYWNGKTWIKYDPEKTQWVPPKVEVPKILEVCPSGNCPTGT